MKAEDITLPDMRSIKETARRFGLPVHFIRKAVADGRIYAVQAGNRKIFVNQQSVIRYLSGDERERTSPEVSNV